MSEFIHTVESSKQRVPYQVCATDVYCTSVNSLHYNKTTVDDLVYIGMCSLYEKVVMQQGHIPFHTKITDQSFTYTSEYKHNKLEIMIMEHNPVIVKQRMFVRFTIVPKFAPTIESDCECEQIESLVLDSIYRKVQAHFDDIEQEEYERIHAKDEHSYQTRH